MDAAAPHRDTAHAVVIGAGVGGLAAAAGLHQRGWSVTVLERAAQLGDVGAGIGLAPNALRALDALGAGEAVRSLSAHGAVGGIRHPSGRWLSRAGADAAAERFGGPTVLVHRAVLIDLLASLLPAGALRTGTAARLADPGGPGTAARVTTARGESIEAGLVVGADGIHSAVRRTLFPGHPAPRYSGLTAWRLVVPALDEPFEPHETWGRGRLWGTQPLHDGRVYAYAAATAPPGGRAPGAERAELFRRFGDWHHPVPDVLAAAEEDAVLRHDLYESARPLPAHHRGRTALLGDAAHPMAPTLGQGGCQALEDAVVLAGLAPPGADTVRALADYTARRRPRTLEVVRRSARLRRAVSLSAPPAVALRSAFVATADRLGARLALRAFDGIADWRPPAPTYAAVGGTTPPAGPRTEPR
ncbi:FAD-dependent monooxygenase [Streptomyces sp. bgisy100]|uniref:FAD-dependent monooxygenase n=1 Tax=Streptomyces sp. bgisy100 TaxID=3413783 RepID=UPI003D721A14